MKARIVNNLREVLEKALPLEDYSGADFAAFAERVQGKVVDLVFIGPDAFEAIDRNWWLPPCCWAEVDANPTLHRGEPTNQGENHGNKP